MDNPLKPSEFAARADISISYASEILSGKRTPSKALAISIYRKTGRKFAPIAEATDAEIDMLERFEIPAAPVIPSTPATPSTDRAAA